jgi:hypothetical protein
MEFLDGFFTIVAAAFLGAFVIDVAPWFLGYLLAGPRAWGGPIGGQLFAGALGGNLAGVGMVWLLAFVIPDYLPESTDCTGIWNAIAITVPGAWLGGITGLTITLGRRGYAAAAGILSLGLGALTLAYGLYVSAGPDAGETAGTLLTPPGVAATFLYGPLMLAAAGIWLLFRSRSRAIL